MADKPVLDYEPLPARGLRRKTVIALLAASAGVAIAVGGVVYRLSQPKPTAVAVPKPAIPLPRFVELGSRIEAPDAMPWQPAQPEKPDAR